MSKSREFDNVLDECLERLLAKGETIAQCLQSFPEQADELKPLLETALATRKAAAIQPRPEFKDRARYQFSLALQETERKRSRPFFSWGWQVRWVSVVAVVLAFLLAGSGTVAAAAGSIPDEPLYPVKLATEQVRLVFTPSALGKAEFYAELADRRVAEIVRLDGNNKPEQIERTARRLDIYLARIADLASTQPVAGGVAMAPVVREMPAPSEALIVEEAAIEEAPVAGAVAEAERAPMLEEAPAVAEAPLLVERDGDGHVDRRTRLRATMGRHAANHPARLRALLKRVPPSARPALLRAIAVSETGYEKALESLE